MDKSVYCLFMSKHGICNAPRAQYVGLEELCIIVYRPRNVRLRGKVKHNIRLGNKSLYELRVPHVSVPEREARTVPYVLRYVLHLACVGQNVKHKKTVCGIFTKKILQHIAADKPRSACEKYLFSCR